MVMGRVHDPTIRDLRTTVKLPRLAALALFALLVILLAGTARQGIVWMGKQPDGGFLVSSGQRIEPGSIPFDGRPIDIAKHPSDEVFAVLNKSEVFLLDSKGVRAGSNVKLDKANAGFRGIAWTPDGKRLLVSTDAGSIQAFQYDSGKLKADVKIAVKPENATGNPVPGGMTVTRDSKRLYVVAANRNAVVEVNLDRNEPIREYPVQTLPFEARLTDDESTLVVSNWGGRIPQAGDRTAKSQDLDVVINDQGSNASGTISVIDLKSGSTRHVEVGIHPTSLLISGKTVYVACASSDAISEVDLGSAKVTRTFPLKWGSLRIFGAMPNALASNGKTLYVADGGDNALAEIDLTEGKVKGFRPAGYFPTAVVLDKTGTTAAVLNTKGNGSVRRTSIGKPGNAHDFQGTVTFIDLKTDLAKATEIVARDNRWEADPKRPALKVYNGAIKHVLYIIKENKTYDDVFGDMPLGNGDPKICSLGKTVMPNHQKIAKQFTLFDNGYVSGTNSADGHQWSTQSIANEYLEHFYVGYSRTYPDDGDDAMAISHAGGIWDAAIAKGKSLRVYGEFADEKLAKYDPMPKDWFECWEDRKTGANKIKYSADTALVSLKPYINHEYHYWPLFQSDQHRADIFIKEYEEFSKADKVPNLMIMSLPCDHAEGLNPQYPTPRAMMADNDLALGRVVEAVSKSPQWKETCIFVIEDDAQSGPDHVDGHRTVYMAISPYNKRQYLDSTFYTGTNMIRSIEMMLGLDPMNKFDSVAEPITDCFTDRLDLAPYEHTPNIVPLDERNPSPEKMTAADKYWYEKTMELDFSHVDAADPYWLNRINWYSVFKGTREYPGRPGEAPGQKDDDDDDDAE